jgi:hypothetical protein
VDRTAKGASQSSCLALTVVLGYFVVVEASVGDRGEAALVTIEGTCRL